MRYYSKRSTCLIMTVKVQLPSTTAMVRAPMNQRIIRANRVNNKICHRSLVGGQYHYRQYALGLSLILSPHRIDTYTDLPKTVPLGTSCEASSSRKLITPNADGSLWVLLEIFPPLGIAARGAVRAYHDVVTAILEINQCCSTSLPGCVRRSVL